MKKSEMFKDVKFPMLGDQNMNFVPLIQEKKETHPSVGTWIVCVIKVKERKMLGLYQWQKENNPKNIEAYTYVNISANSGPVRYVPYPHLQDENLMIICHESQAHIIVK